MSFREFIGMGGYTRQPEGYLSWQHLTFVSGLLAVMIVLAIALGLRNREKSEKERNRVLVASAILIDTIELCKIVLLCYASSEPNRWLYELPLFLCSIHLIALPIAAFSRGRLKAAALDFVCIFGLVSAVMGTYGAGQNYACYPVISLDNVASGLTHGLSGFAALYIMIGRMAKLEKRNMPITFGILGGFCVAAYIANLILDYNYMFLMSADGTPYEILYGLVNGSPVFYPLLVVGLFIVYIAAFYWVYYRAIGRKRMEAAALRAHTAQ